MSRLLSTWSLMMLWIAFLSWVGVASGLDRLNESHVVLLSSQTNALLPIQVVVIVVMVTFIFVGLGVHVALVVLEPPYRVPRMRCLREQLELAHPTWYK